MEKLFSAADVRDDYVADKNANTSTVKLVYSSKGFGVHNVAAKQTRRKKVNAIG